jgi:predicted deacylase
MPITLGTATARPGEIVYGEYDLLEHPISGKDRLPVILAQGTQDGPTFWTTAGIHGPEHAGLQVIHRLITLELVRDLRGTIVAIPTLSPTGLQMAERSPYYHDGDPNRLFPDGKPAKPLDPDKTPPSALEQAFARLFEHIKATANLFFDLHCSATNSVSFVFRDRVLYRKDEAEDKARAEVVDARLAEMCAAYGHSVVNEFPVEKYLDEKLHRSTTAAAVNLARIPALTAELGTGHMPDPNIVRASAAGLRNVMRWAGMLPDEMEPIRGVKIVKPGFPCRRRAVARVPQPCIVHHLVEPGDMVKVGDPLCETRDIWGRPVGEGILRSEYDGWIVSRTHGIVRYPGEAAFLMAIRDDGPMVGPYPDDYFKE